MIASSLLITIALLLALTFWLMGELRFLIPFKSILYHTYGMMIVAWGTVLFINLFAAVFALNRKLFLKDTGRKLSHIDKQIVTGQSPVPPPTEQ